MMSFKYLSNPTPYTDTRYDKNSSIQNKIYCIEKEIVARQLDAIIT